MGRRGASWDFPRAGSQRQPFHLLVGASGSWGGAKAARPPLARRLEGGPVPQAPPQRAGSSAPVPHGRRASSTAPVPWARVGREVRPPPEHPITPARGWGEVGQPAQGQGTVLRRLWKWGFFGGRVGNTTPLILFAISRRFYMEPCVAPPLAFHLQSPVSVGPTVAPGVPWACSKQKPWW